ncbi:MAG: LuxR C-terminal-related transcriptional regulator [Lachnospiraceae bacterium]|nr:LuxR C-terminal-related transcriptional regulator [Lachnospiraceae bacterium]
MPRKRELKPNVEYFSPELLDKLNAISGYPLTLIEAASGFGKTTCVEHFLEQIRQEDETVNIVTYHFVENMPAAQSFKDLCRLATAFDLTTGERLAAFGLPDDADDYAEFKDIISSFHSKGETYVFLDDYQFYADPRKAQLIPVLAQHGDPNLHIIIASHPFPKEDRVYLLPNKNCLHLQEDDLAFNEEDVEAYYRAAGVTVVSEQVKEVMELTNGWVIALYLQLDNLIRRGSFEQGGMSVLMEKAFWKELSDDDRHLLLCLSIYPEFHLGEAAAFSGRSKKETEAMLREKHYFIRYQKHSQTYQMHLQLHKFLESQFALLSEEEQKEIYLQGGRAAWDNGGRYYAIRYFHRAGAYDEFIQLPVNSFEVVNVVDEEALPALLDMLNKTSFEARKNNPSALISLAFGLFFHGLNEDLIRSEDMIQKAIEGSELPEEEKNHLKGELELLMSFICYNRIDAMSERHRKSWELMHRPATLCNLQAAWTFGSPSVLYLYWRETGMLDTELAQMDECMPIYYKLTNGHGFGAESSMRADALLNRGQLAEAEALCYRTLFTADSKKQDSVVVTAAFVLARIAILRGDKAMLEQSMETIRDHILGAQEDLARYIFDMADSFIAVTCGDTDRVKNWLQEGKVDDSHLVIMVQPFAYIIYARYLLEKQDISKLMGACGYCMAISDIFPNLYSKVYCLIYMAAAYQMMGDHPKAVESLAGAVAMAAPDKVYLPFAENMDHIGSLMEESGADADFVVKVTELAKQYKNGVHSLGFGQEDLTPREKEVLDLIRRGLTNGQIAESLNIGVSTVKKEVSNILAKQGVTSRAQLME